MSNTKQAKAGDIVRSKVNVHAITEGKLYQVHKVDTSNGGKAVYHFCDDMGNERAFWGTHEYEVIGNLNALVITQPPVLKDIAGDAILEGGTIAYAFAGAQSRHLALFEVQAINGPTALCRAKADGAVVTLGVFEERAIKVAT